MDREKEIKREMHEKSELIRLTKKELIKLREELLSLQGQKRLIKRR